MTKVRVYSNTFFFVLFTSLSTSMIVMTAKPAIIVLYITSTAIFFALLLAAIADGIVEGLRQPLVVSEATPEEEVAL